MVKSLDANGVWDTAKEYLTRWWVVRNNDKTGEDVEFKMGFGEGFRQLIQKWVIKHPEIRPK